MRQVCLHCSSDASSYDNGLPIGTDLSGVFSSLQLCFPVILQGSLRRTLFLLLLQQRLLAGFRNLSSSRSCASSLLA